MSPGFFIVRTDTDTAAEWHPTLQAAMRAHRRLEGGAKPSRPSRPWPDCWAYMIESETSPSDCRRDLIARSARLRATLPQPLLL